MLRSLMEVARELDDLFEKAVELVVSHERTSSAFLQRRLSIGYARAARIIDQLEEAGVVAPSDGLHARKVLINSYEEFLKNRKKPGQSEIEGIEEKSFEDYKIPTNTKLTRYESPYWGKNFSDVIDSTQS